MTGKDIDVDVFPFPGRKGGAEKTDPKDEISEHRIAPGKTRCKNIAENDLGEGNHDHETKEENQEGLLDPVQDPVKALPSIHHLPPFR
jgi:hypothetical protein